MKNKSILNKIIKFATPILMLIVLLIVILYACVWSVDTTLSVNDKVDDLSLNIYDSKEHCTKNIYESNDKVKVIYFYDEVNKSDLEELSNLYSENVEIYLVSSYKHYETNISQINSIKDSKIDITHFILAYDTDKSTNLLKFKSQIEYPFFLWTDIDGIIKYTSTTSISSQKKLIELISEGYTVGNNVGNICYIKDIETIKLENNTLVANSTFNALEDNGKIKVINFWGYWCTPCKAELPGFNTVASKYLDSVEVVAIHQGSTYLTNDDIAEAYDYINKHSDYVITWAHDDSRDSYYKMLGGKDSYPITIIVDQNGFISFTRTGKLEESELEEQIKKLLK